MSDAWWKQLTIVVPSSPVQSNPSTESIRALFTSLSSLPALLAAEKIIHFDGMHPSMPADRRQRYAEHKRRVHAYRLQAAMQARPGLGLEAGPDRSKQPNEEMSSLELTAFAHTTVIDGSRFLFAGHNTAAAVSQHDFVLVRPFDAKQLLETMTSNLLIKHVRLNLRPNVARGFDTVVQNYSGPSLVPLAKTCGWADAPHVTSRHYYLSFVIPLLMHDHDGGKRKYVEESVHYRMQRFGNPGGCWEFKNALANGNVAAKWPSSFDDYGTYLYGFASAQDGSYTEHRSLRGSAPRWSVVDGPRQLRAANRGVYKRRKSKARR